MSHAGSALDTHWCLWTEWRASRRCATRLVEPCYPLSAFEFLRRFLQHVLPRGLQKIRHYGFLSRRSKIDLETVRAAILDTLRDVEPDLELEAWCVPELPASTDSGPTCPDCGGPPEFVSFYHIRPPPLEHRKESQHVPIGSF